MTGRQIMFGVQPYTTFKPEEAGAWAGVPAEIYHQSPGYSNSNLSMVDESPLRFHLTSTGKLPRRRPTKDMVLGTSIHAIVNEGTAPQYHLKPETYGPENKPWNGNATECKAWLKGHQDKPIFTRDDVQMLEAVEFCCRSDDRFMRLVRCSQPEVTALARNSDLEAPILLRCRPDLFGQDADGWFFVEMKSTRDCSTKAMQKEIVNREYHTQIALYKRVLDKLTGSDVRAYVFGVEKDRELPRTNLRRMSAAFLEAGSKVLDARIALLAKCRLSNAWPALPDFEPGSNIPYIDIPEWMAGDVEALTGMTEAEEVVR